MAYKKYFTLSFDDGLEQDKKIIQILKEYGIRGCTFNLNSGMAGLKRAMGRIGDIGFAEKCDLSVLKKKSLLVRYVEDYRIPADEIGEVYAEYEIAAHAYRHENLKKLSAKELDECVRKDVECLEKLSGKKITGFAYPYGAVSDEAAAALKAHGIRYARTTASSRAFTMPRDPLRLAPTCWFLQKETFDLVEQFLAVPLTEEDQLLYIWGHGYEFDYGTDRGNWDQLRRLCDRIAGAEDVAAVTNGELFSHQ